jgi:predicted dehydrogenase
MIGRVHSLAYRELPFFYPGRSPALRLAAVCTARPETAAAAAAEAGYAWWGTDYRQLIARDDVQVVDCSLPNYLHRDVLLAAFAAGKHVYCEKPLALNAAEAREMAAAAARTGVTCGMTFNYRFVPAVMRARQLLQEDALGEIYEFRAEYLHTGYEDPERPMGWKLRQEQAGGGALVDLGSHVIDMVRHLLGEFQSVRAHMHTYVTERPAQRGATEREPVTVDDAAWVQAKMANGAIGTLEASRFTTGILDDLRFEIHGRRGALRFSLMDGNWLYWYDATRKGEPLGGDRGWTRLETVANYPGAAAPPTRSIVGWSRFHAENQFQFLRAVVEGKRPQPDITDGLRTQLVLDAAYASAKSGQWTTIELA